MLWTFLARLSAFIAYTFFGVSVPRKKTGRMRHPPGSGRFV
jgi:hypothetical protein